MDYSQYIFDLYKTCRVLQIRREQTNSVGEGRHDKIISTLKKEFIRFQTQPGNVDILVTDHSRHIFSDLWGVSKAEILALVSMTIKEKQSSKQMTPREIIDIASRITFAREYLKIREPKNLQHDPKDFTYESLELYLKEKAERFIRKTKEEKTKV